MAKIRWTTEAVTWLQEIHNYIARDNAVAASKVVFEIYSKVQTLQSFPQLGYTYTTVAEGEIRILLYGHYRIAYLVKDHGDIHVLGIFHGALEIEKYLSDFSQ